jgi:hypothetical protein
MSFRGAPLGASPESINHDRGLWIPGLRQEAHPGMTVLELRYHNERFGHCLIEPIPMQR